ncbi:MAG: hypothetical protein AABX11_00500 [Nanoarchaeota archaeon]
MVFINSGERYRQAREEQKGLSICKLPRTLEIRDFTVDSDAVFWTERDERRRYDKLTLQVSMGQY